VFPVRYGVYLCVPYGSHNKQRLFPQTALIGSFESQCVLPISLKFLVPSSLQTRSFLSCTVLYEARHGAFFQSYLPSTPSVQLPLIPVRTFLVLLLTLEILERFHWKALSMIVDAPWYVPNTVIRRDLQTPTVKEEIRRYNSQYSAHPNGLVVNLMEQPDNNRRLRRHLPNDLPTGFLV
jgi:hypothetical protein